MPCRDEFRVHLRKEKWVTCSSSTGYTARAILAISNDESPYFLSSPLPHPVAVPEACRLARSPLWDQMQGQAQLDCPCAAPRSPAL
ncbi:Venom nerve growth factor [Trichinella pseudospiralis]